MLAPREHGVATAAGRRMAGRPVVAFLVVALVGFVLVAAAAVLVGWLLTSFVLPEHGIGHADEHVNVWLAQHRTAPRTDASLWLSRLGDVFAIPALVGLTALIAAVRRRWGTAGFIVMAIMAEVAMYRVVTFAIHRDRPRVPRMDNLPADASYYSGHTAASVAAYCGVALVLGSRLRSTAARFAVWAVALAVVLLVALARMYRGEHHPTDVAAGALVGIGTLLLAAAAVRAGRAAAAAGASR